MSDDLSQWIDAYSYLWTTQREEYVIVPVRFPDGRVFYDLYHRDGTYCTLPDEWLNAAVVERMVAAGVPVVDPDSWVADRRLTYYEPLWTTDRDRYLLIQPHPGDENQYITIYDRVEKRLRGSSFIDGEMRPAVIEKMIDAGVEVVQLRDTSAIADKLREMEERADVAVREAYRSDRWSQDPDASRAGCLVRVLIEPTFERPQCWHLFRRWLASGEAAYFARPTRWVEEADLHWGYPVRPEGDASRFVPTLSDLDLELNVDYTEQFLRHLVVSPIPVYLELPYAAFDGTTFYVTFGAGADLGTELSWWSDGPAEWREVTVAVQQLLADLEALYEQTVRGNG
jgi:hypothetical protein